MGIQQNTGLFGKALVHTKKQRNEKSFERTDTG